MVFELGSDFVCLMTQLAPLVFANKETNLAGEVSASVHSYKRVSNTTNHVTNASNDLLEVSVGILLEEIVATNNCHLSI